MWKYQWHTKNINKNNIESLQNNYFVPHFPQMESRVNSTTTTLNILIYYYLSLYFKIIVTAHYRK